MPRFDPIDCCIRNSEECGAPPQPDCLYESSPEPFAGLYEENYLGIPALRQRIGRVIRLTEDPDLFGARVLWQGLPARSNNCELENIRKEDGADSSVSAQPFTKAMLCIAKRWDNPDEVESADWMQTPFYWFYQRPNCDAVLLRPRELRAILKAELDPRRAAPCDLLRYELQDCSLLYCSSFPILPPELKTLNMETTAQDMMRKRKRTVAENTEKTPDEESGVGSNMDGVVYMSANAVHESNIDMVAVKVDLENAKDRPVVTIPTLAAYLYQEDYQHQLVRRGVDALPQNNADATTRDLVKGKIASLWTSQGPALQNKGASYAQNPLLNRAMDNSDLQNRVLTFLHYYEHYFRSDPRVQKRLALPPHNNDFKSIYSDREFKLAVKALFMMFYVDSPGAAEAPSM